MGNKLVGGFNDLATINPLLSAEWHPTKNGTVTPEQVSAGSHQKAWWECKQGHEWESVIKSRNSGVGCPICAGQKLLIGYNDLATTNSTLASQWHPTKNGELTAQQVTSGLSKKVWWLGTCSHEWEASIQGRNRSDTCPICAGRKLLIGYNDLVTVNSMLANQWHPTKNGELTAQQVLYGSEKRIWWLGVCGHEWDATVAGRNSGSGCPICSGTRVSVGINDLASQYPDLVSEWHPTKNGELTAQHVISGSHKKVWWLGTCSHEWDARISGRIKGVGCPVCSNHRIVIGINDLASQYPDVASEWHPTKNGELIPQQVGSGVQKKVWWKCEIGHEWQAAINQRRRGHGCPTCSRIIVGVNDLAAGNPIIAAQWHPTKNGDLIPRQVGVSAGKKVWWLGNCGHEWDAVIYTRNNGVGCPICSGHKVLVGFNDLAFTNPELAAQWHPIKNGKLTAQKVTSNSNKKVWWRCKDLHEWEAVVGARARRDRVRCPVCLGKQVLEGFNDLALVNPTRAAEWHPTKNGELKPTQVTIGSSKRVWWQCIRGHEWQVTVNSRNNSNGKEGRGCPQCAATTYVSNAEQKLHDYIRALDNNVKVIQSDRKVLQGKELDIYLPSKNIAIEFNGIFWHSERVNKNTSTHYDKWLACKEVGIHLIQIWEDDWTSNPELVKRMIADALELSNRRTVLAHQTTVEEVNERDAEIFLNENHLQGFASGSCYLGLFKEGGIESPVALLVLDEEQDTERKSLDIIRYATSTNVVDGFKTLLAYVINAYDSYSVTAVVDNCGVNGLLYEANGFVEEEKLSPDYMYIAGAKRYPKSAYSMNKFRDDPKLGWAEGFTVEELAYLNDIDRIWDAGKTRYRFIVGK